MSQIIHPSQWARPIEDFRDFSNFTATPVEIEPNKRLLFETKDSTEPSGYKLRAKVRMTFAGHRTRNRAVYLPDEHYRSAISFIKPYNKPIQVHHDNSRDPIGRVIDVRYVDTTNLAASVDSRASNVMQVFRDSESKTLSRIKTVPSFLSMSQNDNYHGVGHILGLWEITDPDAIRKVFDGRYLTVSTTMSPTGCYCSSCAIEGTLVDWAKQVCEHEPGEIVNGIECVKVPIKYIWDEVSPVNNPAAVHARILEVGENLSFSDALQRNIPRQHELFGDISLVSGDKEIRLTDSFKEEEDVYFRWTNANKMSDNANTPDANQANVIGEKEQDRELRQKGQIMKLTELTKDTVLNYEAIAKHLDGVARLTGDLLAQLEDSVFIGPNRTFPIKDLNHANAAKSLLAEVEDSDAKTSLLEAIEEAVGRFAEPVVVEDLNATDPSVGDQTEIVDASTEGQEGEKGLLTITEEALAEFKKLAESLSDANAEKEILKQRVTALKAEVQSLQAIQTETLKAYKGMLADALVDAQIAHGYRISDKIETSARFAQRSLESLRNSLQDLKAQVADGTSRKASGEQVPDPRTSSEVEQETDAVDRSKYSEIINTYHALYYGPSGPTRARHYLQDARAKGLIPANVQP
jgi:hypothetical protein